MNKSNKDFILKQNRGCIMEKSVEVFSHEPEFVNEEVSDEEPINSQLRTHETQVEDWLWGGHVKDFYRFYSLYNEHFFKGLLPVAVIKVERLRHDRPGYYRLERNGFGLKHEICINLDYYVSHFVFHLAVLLHQTLHIRQNARECKGYHDKGFQVASEALGIPVNDKGEITDIGEPFLSFIRQHLGALNEGFDARALEQIRQSLHFKTKRRGKSTLIRRVCVCGDIVYVCKPSTKPLCPNCKKEYIGDM